MAADGDAFVSPENDPRLAFPIPPIGLVNPDDILNWIVDLRNEGKRALAMMELGRRRDGVPQLPLWIWHSYGTVAILMQEIFAVCGSFAAGTLSAVESNRVCNALALLQCVAGHRETRGLFLRANILMYLYPFLKPSKTTKPLEYLRLTVLGVIGAMVRSDDPEAVRYLISTEIMPLILGCMQVSNELSKTVAVFILQKILSDDGGLAFVCLTYERFLQIAAELGKMTLRIANDPPVRLLKHLIKCFRRLADNPRGKQAIFQCLPDPLRFPMNYRAILQGDQSSKRSLRELLMLINVPYPRYLDEQMSSSSSNLKGSSFPTKSPCMDNLSTGGSTITKAYEIVHNRGPHFTQSQFSGQQEVSAYNLPDDSIQKKKCVEPSVKLDYPRYINPPQMGVVPCCEYDVSEFGPTNQEKSYDYPLACPACGGQMILQCQVNGSGMITRHRIIHGNLVQRSFEIVHFQPPVDAGRIARDIALEDEIPSILLQEKDMDNASLHGTECDFETQNIIMEEVQKQKPDTAVSVLRRDKKAEVSKPNFGDVGFGSDDDDLDIVEVPSVRHNTPEATSVNADFVQSSNGGNCVTTAAVNTPSAEISAKPGFPTSPLEVVRSNKPAVGGDDVQVGNCRSLSPNDSTSSDEHRSDHYVFFEKWRTRKDWKFGLFIDSSVTNGFRKLELLTPHEGRIFINVREDLVSQKVINGSDLVAFKPENAIDKTYIVKPVRYHNSLLTGKTKVRFGREIQTEVIALSACPLESVDSLAQAGRSLKLWSDITGLIDVPAADVRKLMAGSIFQLLHLFRIRVSVPHVQNSNAANMGTWKLIRMDAPIAGAKPADIPYYFWPTAAER